MYRPPPFDMQHATEMAGFIDDVAVGHLVTSSATGLASSFIPMLFDRESSSLRGHLARANPQWRDVDPAAPALAIFTGPDAYVSPSFYPSKAESGRVVPTWNYVVVHATGRLVVHDDPAWVTDLVTRLTVRHESRRASAWSVDDAPDGYIAAMAKAVVGVELVEVHLEGKRKLSQNRTAVDIDGTIAGLDAGTPPEQAVARAMRNHR